MDMSSDPSSASRNPRPKRGVRQWFVLIHRITGFYLVIFLVVAGLTGTVLVFSKELDAALNPDLMHAMPPTKNAPMMEPFALRERMEAQLSEPVRFVEFHPEPGHALEAYLTTVEGVAYFNPYDGRLQGIRKWGDPSNGVKGNLVDLVFRLHYALALGDAGYFLFGIAALLWTIDCFVGAYLTFPPKQQRRADGTSGKSWLRRWGPSWLMKTSQLFSSIFTFHRAAGLWLWAVLLVFAWTGVGFNLNAVYQPVMKTFGYHDTEHDLPHLAEPLEKPALDWPAAHARGQELMRAEATKFGFQILKDGSIYYEPEHGAFRYYVYTSLDMTRWAETNVTFDGNEGKFLTFSAPTLNKPVANKVETFIFAMHTATIGGWPYRIFVALLGLIIPLLAISGIWIWWRKRKPRNAVKG